MVVAHKPEEKGSDVNLATFLLIDAMDSDADASVVISDDTDLYRTLTRRPLPSCQFPPTLRDERGIITKPPTW